MAHVVRIFERFLGFQGLLTRFPQVYHNDFSFYIRTITIFVLREEEFLNDLTY